MRFASLGSGSRRGNALVVVESGGTRVLLDCGFASGKPSAAQSALAP